LAAEWLQKNPAGVFPKKMHRVQLVDRWLAQDEALRAECAGNPSGVS